MRLLMLRKCSNRLVLCKGRWCRYKLLQVLSCFVLPWPQLRHAKDRVRRRGVRSGGDGSGRLLRKGGGISRQQVARCSI